MMMRNGTLLTLLCLWFVSAAGRADESVDSARRTAELKSLRWGMFICWSFSTFSGQEWTPGVADASFFRATGCDTEQWARTAQEAQMGYILFLTKHHDGFCLWDTQTTDRKVTKSPLGRDVLRELRKSCDQHGIKLALYFSEGDWTWPGAVDGQGGAGGGGANPEMKKAQLKELLTQYGPIEYIWFDHAVGEGGLSHAEKLYEDYLGAVKFGNLFSLDVGPDYAGRLRDIDVRTLREVGKLIRTGKKVEAPK